MPDATAVHEAGHSAAALVLKRQLRFVTARPGEAWAGCTLATGKLVAARVPDVSTPLPTWGLRWQHRLLADAIYTLAGDVAEELWVWRDEGRVPERVAQAALNLVEAAGPELASDAERALAEAAVNDKRQVSDADRLAKHLWVMFGDDTERAYAYTTYATAETRALLLAHADGVARLGALLEEHGTVGGRAAATALRGGTG